MRTRRVSTPALFALLACLLIGGPLAAQGHEHSGHKSPGSPQADDSDDATARHSFRGVEQWVERFEDPGRPDWQQPQKLLRILGVSRGDRVADLGAGTGFFLPYLSAIVGNLGRVYAVDIEQEMLDYIEQREDIQHNNLTTILAAPDDPKLPVGELDCVLIVNTWHHIDDRRDYVKKLSQGLKPGGRVVVVDFYSGDLPVGPPPGHKLKREKVVQEFEAAGWQFTSESVALPYQYVLVFYPPTS